VQVVAAVGAINGDDRTDFVGRAKGRLVVFLSNARGGFRRVARAPGMRGYRQVVGAGDVTGDGRPDFWAQNHRGRVFLHRGLARRTFSGREPLGRWRGVSWLAGGGDYSGDGVPDLVARRRDGALMVLPSRRDGSLGRPVGPVRGPGLSTFSGAGQLVGDEAPDLLATRTDGALVVVPNRGTYNLGSPIDTGQSFGRGNLLLNAGDFSGDGHGDVIMRRRNGSLWLFAGHGDGRLSAPVRIAGRRPFRTVSGLRVTTDVTGDGRHDVVGRMADGEVRVWPGSGAEPLGGGEAVTVAASPTPKLARSRYDWVVATSDLRGRGPGDVVARDGKGHLYRLNGNKRGFRPPHYLGEAVGFDLGG
jgi:hypothetical protein